MDKEFVKQKCIDNIRMIAEEKGVKVSDIEREAGVSAGYISRLAKGDNSTVPSTEVIIAASKCLGVPADIIMQGNFKRLSKNEKKTIMFLQKVVEDTNNDTVTWEKLPMVELNKRYDLYRFCMYRGDFGGNGFQTIFRSAFHEDYCARLNGDCFVAPLFPNEEYSPKLFIADIESLNPHNAFEEKKTSIEVYIIDINNNMSTICTTLSASPELNSEIQILLSAISDKVSNVTVDSEMILLMDDYINGNGYVPF